MNTHTHKKNLHSVCNKHINMAELNYFSNSTSELRATFVQNDTGDLIMSKKKLKMKKRRLKEEVKLWEESRRCSDGQNDEAAEPPSKKSTPENDKISKRSTGMRFACTYSTCKKYMLHKLQREKRDILAMPTQDLQHLSVLSCLPKITLHHLSLSAFELSDQSFRSYTKKA